MRLLLAEAWISLAGLLCGSVSVFADWQLDDVIAAVLADNVP